MDIRILSFFIGIAALLISLAALFLYFKLYRYLRKFFAETGHEEFGQVLLSHQRQLRRGDESMKITEGRLDQLESQAHLLLNQIGLVRYNPFSDSGGNMSFSMALINNNGDGAVVTSLHSREGNRIYAKTIKNYSSDQHLTNEEKEAIERARRENNS